jgi:hypothetical protein
MERIELFQPTSLHGTVACHRLTIPPVFPPTQNDGKLLLHQICLIYERNSRTITSLGQSNSLPPLHVASTSKHRKLLIGCFPHFLAEIGGGTSSGWVSTAAVSIYRDRERKFTHRLYCQICPDVSEDLSSYLKRVSFFPFESRPSCSSPSRNSSTVAFLDGLVLDGPGESGELILVIYLSTYLI